MSANIELTFNIVWIPHGVSCASCVFLYSAEVSKKSSLVSAYHNFFFFLLHYASSLQ